MSGWSMKKSVEDGDWEWDVTLIGKSLRLGLGILENCNFPSSLVTKQLTDHQLNVLLNETFVQRFGQLNK